MESLELLEHKIGDLLKQLEYLREENAQLSQASVLITQMRDENAELMNKLEKERGMRSEVNERIERIINSIAEHKVG